MNQTNIVYEIAINHLCNLVTSVTGKSWEQGSLYHNVDQTNEALDVKGIYPFESDPLFLKTASILANPDHWIIQRVGGNQMALETGFLYHKTSGGDAVVFLVKDLERKLYMVKYHETYKDYIAWWVETFGSPNKEVAVNYMPPKITLPKMVSLLHFIDCYRRVTYHNLLNHSFTQVPKIDSRIYYETLNESIKSEDGRWLLPSIEMLLPSVGMYDYEIQPRDLKVLMDLDFADGILPGEETSDIIFGAIGIVNGLEFMNGWIASLGFEFYHIDGDQNHLINQLYIASTTQSNHSFQFVVADHQAVWVNHQVFTEELLTDKFDQWVQELFVLEPTQVIVPDVIPTPIVTVGTEEAKEDDVVVTEEVQGASGASKFCISCGTKLDADAKFCMSCGTKLD